MSISNRYRILVDQFRARSEENYIFACQAAVPLLLTRDLLYQLWNNFKRYQYEFNREHTSKISHIAISDLLLSPLCREVGHELYEIPKEARDLLFEELVLNLGEKRKNTIAAFLEEYALLEQHFSRRKRLKSIHLLTALSILDPHEMEKQIIIQINEAKTDQEKLNLLMLHSNLVPLGFESDLRKISSAVAGVDQTFSPILIAEEDPLAPGVLNVMLPVALRSRVHRTKRQRETAPPLINSKALTLIKDCSTEGRTRLDLGGLGLTDADFIEHSPIDEALRQCSMLRTLILSNEWFDLFDERWHHSNNWEGQNKFSLLPPALQHLPQLSTLICGGDKDADWQISDMTAIRQLEQLRYINLTRNGIEVIAGLEELANLEVLLLSYNKIKEIDVDRFPNRLSVLTLQYNKLEDITGLIPLIKRSDRPMKLSVSEPNSTSSDYIAVNGNPFVTEHPEVFLRGDKAIMAFVDAQVNLRKAADEEPVWRQIQIDCTDIKENDTIRLHFSILNQPNDLEGTIFADRKVIHEIIDQTDVHTWTATKGKALLELLIPANFEKYFDGHNQLVLFLDPAAALYPWELIVGPGPLNLAKPLCLHVKIIRRIIADRYSFKIPQQAGNDALIIGNPLAAGFTPALPIAEKEAANAANILRDIGLTAKLINGQTAERIISSLFSDNYRIIHIAAHGTWQNYPEGPAGVVIGNNIYLKGSDFRQMATVPELIFLNCDYIGRTSMAQELLQCGVKAVLVPHDFMDDNQAEAFSSAFYQRMAEGMHFAEAVMQARLAMLTPGIADYFPATYQCYGDPYYRLGDTPAATDTVTSAEKKKKTGHQRSSLIAWLMSTSRQTIGTGFLVTREMLGVDIEDELLLMTCWHVVAEEHEQPATPTPTNFIARFEELIDKESFSLTEVVWASAENDMDAALLRFEKNSHDRLVTLAREQPFYPVAEKLPDLNSSAPAEIFVIGYPEGQALKIIDEGCVLLDRTDRILHYSRVTRPGSAGSAVFNANWELIGLHRASGGLRALNGKKGVHSASEGISIHAIIEQMQKDLGRTHILKKKVFLASSYTGLNEYRNALTDFFRSQSKNFELIAFDSYFDHKDVIDINLTEVRLCDIMIFLVDDRPGYIPKRDDQTLVEMAFDAAIRDNKPILAFFVTPEAADDGGDHTSKLSRPLDFKLHILKTVSVKEVRSPKELVSALSNALREIEKNRS